MMKNFDLPVNEIVKRDYRTADVFKKWQLNFCCGGEMPLKLLCETRQVDYQQIVSELENATRNMEISNQIRFQDWKIDFLIDFVVHVHHDYIYDVLPSLKIALDDFAMTHSQKFPELISTTELMDKLFKKITQHNHHEDEIIFPYIKQMYSAYKRNEAYGNLFVRTLRKPLSNVEKEQLEIDELIQKLKINTMNFQAISKPCTSYEVLIWKLREFYNNLVQHHYLERNILFPKAIEIEQKLLSS